APQALCNYPTRELAQQMRGKVVEVLADTFPPFHFLPFHFLPFPLSTSSLSTSSLSPSSLSTSSLSPFLLHQNEAVLLRMAKYTHGHNMCMQCTASEGECPPMVPNTRAGTIVSSLEQERLGDQVVSGTPGTLIVTHSRHADQHAQAWHASPPLCPMRVCTGTIVSSSQQERLGDQVVIGTPGTLKPGMHSLPPSLLPNACVCVQNEAVLLRMAKYTGITCACTASEGTGTIVSSSQQERLGDQVVIGTPGTLKRWMTKDRILPAKSIKILVFDEADHMLDQVGALWPDLCS
ncbi:unnamed protein product, partial [Closterium sp. NIES-54]